MTQRSYFSLPLSGSSGCCSAVSWTSLTLSPRKTAMSRFTSSPTLALLTCCLGSGCGHLEVEPNWSHVAARQTRPKDRTYGGSHAPLSWSHDGVSGILQQGSGERSVRAPAGHGGASSGTNLHCDAVTMVPQRCYITPSTRK